MWTSILDIEIDFTVKVENLKLSNVGISQFNEYG